MPKGIEHILTHFPDITKRQTEQFAKLADLYKLWNSRINVISRKDIDQLYQRHVLHSLAIAKLIQFKPNTRILDVGTGGGFPGVPLAIMFPDSEFHLIDSIGKKIKVVKSIVQELELGNVTAEQVRAEDVKRKFHFVVSRAVTQLPLFLQWVAGKFDNNEFNNLKNGVLYLKGGDLFEELAEVKKKTKVFELNDWFADEFFETKKLVWLQSS